MIIDLLLQIRQGNARNKEQVIYNSKQPELSTGW